MDPALITAGAGILTSLIGGAPKTPGYVKENYRQINGAIRRANELYDGYDPAAEDADVLAHYSDGAIARAQQLLQNYDATRLGAGGRIGGMDTQANRARTQIAGDAAFKVADLGANLASTRTQRKAALLPQASQAAAGAQSAYMLDQSERARQLAQTQGVMDIATLIAGLTKRGAPSPAGGGTDPLAGNDALNWASTMFQPVQPIRYHSSGGRG